MSMTKAGVLRELRRRARMAGSQAKAAKALGVTPAAFTQALRGSREPGPALLRALGFERVVLYRRRRRR